MSTSVPASVPAPVPAPRANGGTDDSFPADRTMHVNTWNELRDLLESDDFRGWAFRGQPNERWPLESSLSRYLRWSGVKEKHWHEQEARSLRIFRRKAHLYLNHIPDPRDSFQWLALMQHHGAATRLLDFTWSPYVATFYALGQPLAPGTNPAIWAVNQMVLNEGRDVYRPWILGNYEKHFLPNSRKIVLVGEPHHMNQRLVAHSATFVIPGVINIPVEDVITRHIDPGAIAKIVLHMDRAFRRKALEALYSMNITYATLFPGLDGLAQSMRTELEMHWARDPVQDVEYFPKPAGRLRKMLGGLAGGGPTH